MRVLCLVLLYPVMMYSVYIPGKPVFFLKGISGIVSLGDKGCGKKRLGGVEGWEGMVGYIE